MEGFQKKNCGVCTHDKWNFKPTISPIFHFELVNEGWIIDILCVNAFSILFIWQTEFVCLKIIKIILKLDYPEFVMKMNSNSFAAKYRYGVPNSNPVGRKSFTFRSKNNNKTHGNVKLFLATGFELVYAIIAVYFSTCSVSCGNSIPFANIPA